MAEREEGEEINEDQAEEGRRGASMSGLPVPVGIIDPLNDADVGGSPER